MCCSYGQEIKHILHQATKFESEGEFEQARYYYSIALERDTPDTLRLANKLFSLDSIILFNKASDRAIQHIIKGDSAYLHSTSRAALVHYALSGQSSSRYIATRTRQILNKEPDLKIEWMALLAKMKQPVEIADTSSISDSPQDSRIFNFTTVDWTLSDSISYTKQFDQLVAKEKWEEANRLTMDVILQYGYKDVFNDRFNKIYEARRRKLKTNENSILLKLEKIEKLEQSEPSDNKGIVQILNSIDIELVRDHKTRKKLQSLLKKYGE
ncbi:MAG: hypothetical protein CL833_16470 [Crocinitomicaceae bacterium]|nr:hypothetical protein [Crocinitomicaceae bacterium]